MDVTEVDRIHIRQRIYEKKAVGFSLNQQSLEEAVWADVARIDC